MDESDKNQIYLEIFIALLDEFTIKLTPEEEEIIWIAFPGRDEGDVKKINLGRLYQVSDNTHIKELYDQVEISDDDEADGLGDFSGYNEVGKYGVVLGSYTLKQLVQKLYDSKKYPALLRSIKDIDQDNNGYVTTTELDDMLKVHLPELKDKDLKKLFKPWASIQNRILIDYKKVKEHLQSEFKIMKQRDLDIAEQEQKDKEAMEELKKREMEEKKRKERPFSQEHAGDEIFGSQVKLTTENLEKLNSR